MPVRSPEWLDDSSGAARAGGFSLHAGIDIAPNNRPKLERLCRYVSRPPVATERMALTSSGEVRYALKTAYRDGSTHIVIEPLDFMARLAALVPPPRMHLTRYHGVLAPHSKLRGGDARAPGNGRIEAACSRIGQAADAQAPGDELGAAAEARVWHRDRGLCPLRWQAEGHRQHRGAGGDRKDPR